MTNRSPSQSMTMINVADSARKLDVNNRISLRYYYRIADNIMKQAAIFRKEGDIIDLYVMLLRFSSLVTETIPRHRDYKACHQGDKIYLKKRLLDAIVELEGIKSAVKQKIEDMNRKQVHRVNGLGNQHHNNYLESSSDRPLVKQQNLNGHSMSKAYSAGAHDNGYLGQRTPQVSTNWPLEDQFQKIALSVPRPTVETLSRHSILGPRGLNGQWQPPPTDKRVFYPSNIDRSPVEIPSVQKPVEADHRIPVHDGRLISNDRINSVSEMPKSEPADISKKDSQISQVEEPVSLISFDAIESIVPTEIIRQPSPPPVLADIQDLIPTTSPANDAGSVSNISSPDGLVCAEAPLELHIPTSIMEGFMRLAKSNTAKDLETCGILAGSLKNRKFYITALIIPKQESTSNSCSATNEEEIFEVQDKRSLFPLGWIHTHPTQSCFMSSIDVHTHYSYQIMLPEAIAIVMAPTDSSRNHGIFRLTTGGLTVIKQCPMRGFHSHDPPDDGSPIYKQCTNVYINPNLQFDIIDLR